MGSLKLILSTLTDAIVEAKNGVVLHDPEANVDDMSMAEMVRVGISKPVAVEEEEEPKTAAHKKVKKEVKKDKTEPASEE